MNIFNLLRRIKAKLISLNLGRKKIDSINILDEYVLSDPSHQNIVDIFKGEWSSKFPDDVGVSTEPSTATLFDDARIPWTEEVFGSLDGYKVLELGPLEGAHSYMFQERGVGKVTAIEANKRAFLKCLCTKEILKLDKVEFLLGDFQAFLNSSNESYDLVFASGVLYHMEEPIELLHSLSKVTDKLFIWTQYYDENIISNNADIAHKFTSVQSFEFQGESYDYSTQSYKESLDWSGFCGGSEPVSKWLTRDSIIKALEQFGFADIQINFDHSHHQNGPAFALCAKKG